MKRKLLLAAVFVASALGMRAETDVPFLFEKGDFSGVAISSLSTFVPNGTTYTLELTGCTAGTAINVLGGSFSYTPTVDGTVRFVRNGGDDVYVYEESTYKGTVKVSDPDAPTFPTGLTSASIENLIQNGGFEDTSAGTYTSGRYKPTHWTPYNKDKGTPDNGVSVRSGNEMTGSYNMLMHNAGYYLTQQLASGVMKNFTPYQISYNYRANTNNQAGAKYKFQVGSEEFKSDYFSSDENNKGTESIQTFTTTFTTPATIVNQPYVQLYRTGYVSNNSNQDLDRFDEFILVAANGGGIGITGATSATFLSGSAFAPVGAFGASTSYSLESSYPTSLVTNGTFDSNINGWTTTTSASSSKTAENQKGAFTGKFWENWNGSAFTGKMYQSVENIPNGTYKLNICAFVNTVDAAKGQYVYANDNKTYVYTTTPTAYTVYTYVTANELEYGLNQSTAVANWMGIDNVSLEYCGASDLTLNGFQSIYNATTNHLEDGDYVNVTGEEKTNLQTAVNAEPTASVAGYADATFNIGYADYVFMGAKDAYDAFVAAKAAASPVLAYAATAKKTALDNAKAAAAATSASDANAKTAAITTALRAYYESHALAEGEDDAVNYASAIADADPDVNTGWTNGIGLDDRAEEKYTDASGNASGKYYMSS